MRMQKPFRNCLQWNNNTFLCVFAKSITTGYLFLEFLKGNSTWLSLIFFSKFLRTIIQNYVKIILKINNLCLFSNLAICISKNSNFYSRAWNSTTHIAIKVSKSRKQFIDSSILPKNERKKIDFTTMIAQVEFFCSFLGELRRP